MPSKILNETGCGGFRRGAAAVGGASCRSTFFESSVLLLGEPVDDDEAAVEGGSFSCLFDGTILQVVLDGAR